MPFEKSTPSTKRSTGRNSQNVWPLPKSCCTCTPSNSPFPFLRFIQSQSKKGPLSSAPSVIFAFLNANTFASNGQIDKWKQEVQLTASAVPPGLRKRLDKQAEWFLNDNSVEGEYVATSFLELSTMY